MPSNIDTAPEDMNQEKIAFYKGLLAHITVRIRRPLAVHEKLALSFLVEKYWTSQETDVKHFSDRLFDLSDRDLPHDLIWKFSQFFSRLGLQECTERAKLSDSEERARLSELGKMYQFAQSNAELAHRDHTLRNIGGIPDYWLPDWIRDISV